ncbi:shikimate kinase [Brevibacterium sp. 50QC2O2]|jgi:shikimate kinase|uniref:shikimate kinase n=1 Tax=Brevibacterium TaxID=1696 RepID=UPI00211C59B4|nr:MULTISPECIES: shikimate kinase [unclassified Brevibacterium]MCQ9366894.1 shikimate kinase [Brevibacterium sp. 91QC2O2]MCQ9384044.1 shikimate kinase [Brevibacterium sp. 68QC2CO]MCQ9389102.1 shikimate kinase [Brevibacterium sp. 50QC2O2]
MVPPEEGPLPRPAAPVDPLPAAGARLALIGPPTAGKSTIGRLLADRLDIPLIDTDQRIVDRYGPIQEIFTERGEARFREIEREVVRRALRGLLDGPGVVSLGGGAILNPGTRAQLKHPAIKVVNIVIDAQTALERLGGSRRPLLDDAADRLQAFERLQAERAPLYRSVATLSVSATNDPPSTIVNRIVDIVAGMQRAEDLKRYGDLGAAAGVPLEGSAEPTGEED